MADDKSKVGAPDRARVAGDEDYEVYDFAEKMGITPEQARELIEEFGNNRDVLEHEAKKLKGS